MTIKNDIDNMLSKSFKLIDLTSSIYNANDYMTLKTQKANGIMKALSTVNKYASNLFFDDKVCDRGHFVIVKDEDLDKKMFFPVFARPCPTVPKHGFVDSRVVYNRDELKALWKEVKKEDPNGEIILGKYMQNVKYNAVYVSSGLLSIGLGHDGATGGKNSISFPVAPIEYSEIQKKAEIALDDAFYLETVSYKSSTTNALKWNLVQVRGGPHIQTDVPDFIPKNIKVKEIKRPSNDLIKWETEVKKFKAGTVVYAPGYTLASHAAIHCIINKIPFITTFEPKVGNTLTRTEKRRSNPKISSKEFQNGVNAALKYCKTANVSDMRKLFIFSLSVLHNWSYLRKSDMGSWILGAGSAIFAKLSTALVLGEARHSPNSPSKKKRDKVYVQALHLQTKHVDLPKAFRSFYHKYWGGNSFGGLPWATCSWYTIELWKHIGKAYNTKTSVIPSKVFVEIISTMNKITNLAHNNGWWFNKIAEKEDMDFAAERSALAALCTADVYMDIYSKLESSSSVKLKNVRLRYSPCRLDKNNNLYWVLAKPSSHGSDKLYSKIAVKYENGKTISMKVKISSNELKGLKLKFNKESRPENFTYTPLRVYADHKFAIPGGKKRAVNSILKGIK